MKREWKKREWKMFRLLLLWLCAALAMTGAALAAEGYSVQGVDVNRAGGTAAVSLTAAGDCSLFAAVYDGDGRFVSFASVSVTGAAGEQTKTVAFPGGIGEDASVSAFLADANCTPLCETEAGYDGNVYAILYSNGTMVFQHGDTPESGKTVNGKWPVSLAGFDWNDEERRPETPWYEVRESVKKVVIADRIKPQTAEELFFGLNKLEEIQNLSNLDISGVTSLHSMFEGCESLTGLDVSGFDTRNVKNMGYMFRDCKSLTSLDVSRFDTGNVKYMMSMFDGCESLTSLDVSGFDTRNVTYIGYMFRDCKSLTSLDVSNFDTRKVTYMAGMFSHCEGLTGLDLSSFQTGNVTEMYMMFSSCQSLASLNLSGFDTANVTDMSFMFYGCSGLTSLNVSGFDTGNVTNMNALFYECSGLTGLNVSGFDTANVTNMGYMFFGCSRLTSLDVSSFDTGNVTSMEMMFDGCAGLTTLDVSAFHTGNVEDMGEMFEDCTNLRTIYVSSNFVTENARMEYAMFQNCTSLVGGSGTVYDEYNHGIEYARIDNPPSAPGYFTRKSAA